MNSNSAFEGNGFASFLLGAPDGGSVPVNVFPHMQWTFVAPWIQDDWRVSNKLTLNLGFRWDFNSPVGRSRIGSTRLRHDARQSGLSAGRPAGAGRRDLRRRRWPSRHTRGSTTRTTFSSASAAPIRSTTKPFFAPATDKYFLNPTGESFLNGFSQSTPIIPSIDGGRTPTYALANPWPDGILEPPGSALGPLTFLGRGPGFSNPDFVVPNVHQFSAGIQRELPWQIALEATYVGSRSYDMQSQWNGFNEPSLEFVRQCDITQGGSRSFCDALLPNPFFGVAAFEGTTRFTNPTLSRFELNRPFPAFTGINMTERNDGRLWYDSAQFVANKRWSRGVTLNATYTWVPRWRNQGSDNGGQAFIDNITLAKIDGPYYAHREHRITASGVWELPWRDRRDLLGYLLGGWSIAPMFVYQSGQPWGMPSNVELLADPGEIALSPRKDGQFIYGVEALRRSAAVATGRSVCSTRAVAYGCTEPLFMVREPFQRRTTQFRYDEFRRPSFWQVDLNFAKTTPITDRVRLQVRLEAFNLFNSPMYDERQYNSDTGSADFGRINRNSTGQSNFQRFVQLGFRLTF